MELSRRERYVAAGTVIAVAIFALDGFVLTPIQERNAAMEVEKQRILTELERARVLFARMKKLSPRLQEMLDAGLKFHVDEAESQVLHAIRDWSQQTGFALSSLRPERAKQNGKLQEITFQASGTGPMSSVARFLWQLESSSLPIRVAELQIGTRKEGTDDLTLQLRVSALCQPAARPTAPDESKVPTRTGGKDND